MLKNITLLLLIVAVIFIFCQATRDTESYRPFVTLYGTNPIRQRRGGWRWFQAGGPGPGGSCPWCPYGQTGLGSPTFNPQSERQLGFTPYGEGMYTSTYGDVCSRYGSSNVDVDASIYYMGSRWCPVGVVTNQASPDKLSSTQALEARFMGNSWSFRVRDGVSGMYIYLNSVGQGPYGAYRDGDLVQIPGKSGDWKAQIQTQYQPYLLYLPF
jgi:hypothetical protein